MSVDTPSNDPLSIIPTQKAPEVQSSPQTPEVKKEITENEVLTGLLEKYQLSEAEFKKLGIFGETQVFLQNLKNSLKAEKKDINLENLVDEAYQEYVKKKLKNKETQTDSEFSIDKIGESIGSNRLNKFNEVIDKYFDAKLEKYNFVDNSTKEFLKINIYNQLLENGFLNIINTQIGGTNKLFNDIFNGSIKHEELINEMSQEKEGEPKISIVGFDLLNNYLSPCLKKFDEIEAFFKENKIEEKEKKQNIFSNIEFFRDPNNFSKIGEFNVKTIDINLTTKFDGELNVEELSEMILKSKDLQEKLSDALAGGEKSENLIYRLSNNETTGKNTSKLMQMLFKIPLFGKMFAGLLGYDQNNPMLDYMQTSKGFGLYDSLTKLGKHKEKTQDGKEETVEGKNMFEGIEFQIDFQAEKALFKEVGKTFPELKDKEGYNNFWLKAFGDGYNSNEGDKFSFKVDNNDFDSFKKDDLINQEEFGKLIKDALKKYNDDKNKALNPKTEVATQSTDLPTNPSVEPSFETKEITTQEIPEEKPKVETSGEGNKEQTQIVPSTEEEEEEAIPKPTTTRDNTPVGAIKTTLAESQTQGYKTEHSLLNSDSQNNNIDPYTGIGFEKRPELIIINQELTKNATRFLLGFDTDSVLKNNFTGSFGDYYQFEKIRMSEILKYGTQIDSLIIDTIGKSDYNKLINSSPEKMAIIRESIRILNCYIREKIYFINKTYYNNINDNDIDNNLEIKNYRLANLLNSNIQLIQNNTNEGSENEHLSLTRFLKNYNLK